MRLRPALALLIVGATLGPRVAAAQPAQSYALFRLDPLGIAPEIVDQLERILRVELERVTGAKLPARATIEQLEAANPKLAGCTANPACLTPLAKALKATRVVAGNVGGLADSYVINLKLVDRDGHELRRVSATLRGSSEELIDEVRVAAFRLIAPERLVGAIAVLSDVPGATVRLDGVEVGRTPLQAPLFDLSVGVHQLEVTREGFSPFAESVPVRFEKTTEVVVHQPIVAGAGAGAGTPGGRGKRIYERWYFWAGVGVVAIAAGVAIGFALPKQEAVDCATAPCR
jgi:hypothetical protein